MTEISLMPLDTLEPAPAVDGFTQTAAALSRIEDGRFARLPEQFYSRVATRALPEPYLVAASASTAQQLGLSEASLSEAWALELFSGNQLRADPTTLAAVYSGHQFGIWAGQLGDGRAISLGDVAHAGRTFELQLKGAGPTPYSRGGDGRAVLRSSIREYLCSEAMAALGIPTTRALCVMGSDTPVVRESVETAAVVTRVAESFVRFGSFEHWYHQGDAESVRTLADFVIKNFHPELTEAANPYASLLRKVTEQSAELVAAWQSVGFCHGVLNTDNMSILGLTLDYGPFGFMEAFDAAWICNHSDQQGRYAYRMQPQIVHWNLYCLGQALLPLIGTVETTQAELETFSPAFERAQHHAMRAKLGLVTADPTDALLVEKLFALLQQDHVDFTLFFRSLCALRSASSSEDGPIRDLFIDREGFDRWSTLYRDRLRKESRVDRERATAMRKVNPKFVLRNYLAENAIRAAQGGDFSEVKRLSAVLATPFDEQPGAESYAALPPDWARGLEVSCSS